MPHNKLMDPITVEVIRNSLQSIVDEMGLTIIRLAHSLIFAECRDFSVAIFSADAELLAFAQYVAAHQGTMKSNLDAVLRIVGKDNLFPGDVVMTNDPYLGGVHAQDLTFVTPYFYEGQIIAYGTCVAHRSDIGGMEPGGFCPHATEVYQEGILFPCIKLVDKGKMREDILRLYLTNVRLSEDQLADTQAQLAALRGCERALKRLVDRYGVDVFIATIKEILALSERRARAEIERIPDGVYTYTDYTEHDGFTDRDWKIQVAVEIRGSDIYVDFSGTDEQAKGSINCAPYLTIPKVWQSIMFWLDPSIPKNQGLYRAIKEIRVPKGTILNPNHPAPVSGSVTDTAGLILDVMLGALTRAAPEQGWGCWPHVGLILLFMGINPETGKRFILLTMDGLGSGGGARSNADGWLVSHVDASNMLLASIEVTEQHVPIRYLRRELITDHGGDGKFRGGPGHKVQYEILAPMEIIVSYYRHRHPPLGAAGGMPGGTAAVSIVREGQETVIPQKAARVPLMKGDILKLTCCGGGGYGKPEERDPELVRNDIEEGIISLEKARNVYGFKE